MKTLLIPPALLSVLLLVGAASVLLLGCSSPEGHMDKANQLIRMAEVAFSEGRRSDVELNLRQASDQLADISFEETGVFKECRQLYFDVNNATTLIGILHFRMKFEGATPDQLINAYEMLNNSTIIPKELFDHVCKGLVYRPVYTETNQKFAAAHEEAEGQYAKFGQQLSLAQTVKSNAMAQLDFERRKDWDKLSAGERSDAARGDPAVEACINAALAKNSAAKGVTNIVGDVATLCRDGLR